ncbi:MAG: hypothetical protein IJB84_02640 [Lachnospiraceae bacterium]|nr:hypothetical protein [Lachnospiraceae bacterium]
MEDYEKLAAEWCAEALPKTIKKLVQYTIKKVLEEWQENLFEQENMTPEELAVGLNNLLEKGNQLIQQAELRGKNIERIAYKYDTRPED